jgi:hypothetical protein
MIFSIIIYVCSLVLPALLLYFPFSYLISSLFSSLFSPLLLFFDPIIPPQTAPNRPPKCTPNQPHIYSKIGIRGVLAPLRDRHPKFVSNQTSVWPLVGALEALLRAPGGPRGHILDCFWALSGPLGASRRPFGCSQHLMGCLRATYKHKTRMPMQNAQIWPRRAPPRAPKALSALEPLSDALKRCGPIGPLRSTPEAERASRRTLFMLKSAVAPLASPSVSPTPP